MSAKNSFTTKISLLAIALSFSVIFLSGACFGQQDDTKEIRVLGVGVVQGEETSAARDQAVSYALASAVERALEDIVPSDVIVKNFKTLDNNLFGNAGDYIRNYKVLIENRKEATLRIYLQASVFSEKIRARLSELGVVLAETDLPNVLFVIAEQNIADLLPFYWWGEDPSFVMAKSEEAMAAVFKEKGYSVVDHGATLSMGMENLQATSPEQGETEATAEETQEDSAAQPTVEQDLEPIIFNNPYLSNQEAAQLGYRLKADLVIVGTAAAAIVPNTMGATIRSFKAEVSLRAVDTNSRQQVAAVDQVSVETSEDEIAGGNAALIAAGRLAGDKLASQIVLTWKKGTKVSGKVEILIKGTSDLGSYVALRRALQEIPGVSGLRIEQMKADQATLSVDYDRDSHALAESLMRRSFENFGVDIYELENNSLRLEILPARRSPSYLE